ncbi:MAG: dienelactone hydrolase family protein [Burkholderiaceae bacterium]
MTLPSTCWARLLAAFALATSCAGMIATAQAQALVADFSEGQPSGPYSFASRTPKTLADLLKGEAQAESVNIVGHLFLPSGTEKAAAVVLMHGSGGIYSAMLEYWPKQFNAAGYAVLSVDSFGPRGVKSTAEDQSQVPFAADVADAFAALKLLASHPRIDAGRIAIMGFSRGGITTWRAAVERLIAAQKLPDGLRFAAHLPVYSGGCVGAFRLIVKPGVFSKAPMLWIHGDADDYTPIAPCQDYAQRIGKAGTPVEFVVIKGARHKFDSDDPKRYDVRGAQRTLADCPVEIDIDTLAAYDRFTGQRLSGGAYEAALKNSCRALGASVEGDRGARDKAAEAALGFLRKVLVR